MNPRPAIPFDDSGAPVPAVGFIYPDDEPAEVDTYAIRREYLAEILGFLCKARTPRAQRTRIEAAHFVIAATGETVTAAAKRIGISRKHFSKAVAGMRRVTALLSVEGCKTVTASENTRLQALTISPNKDAAFQADKAAKGYSENNR